MFPVRIVDKTRGRRTRDRNEAVFGVVREIEGLSPNVARNHVAVGVIRVRVAIRERRHRVFVIRIVRRVVDSAFAGEIPGGRVVSVGFAVQAARLAGGVGTEQAVERVVGEGLRLRTGL